jgi:predicted nucleic acid-binding protein
MVLVDTSVWVGHFRAANVQLQTLLETGEVAIHPFIIGELACGGLTHRQEILALLQTMPTHSALSQEEYLHFVDVYNLAGKGIGFVDVHLLASTLIKSDFLWTIDKKLDMVAHKLKIAFR